jgi:hypothetical protein
MNRRYLAAGVVAVLVLAGVGLGFELFAPERTTVVAEEGSFGPDAAVLARGEFVDKAGHSVSGTVELVQDGDAYYLRFVDYEQTQGPDVYVYVTEDSDPDTTDEVETQLRVRIDGGADGGESTKQGTFVQRLPADFDPASVNGVAIWCDRFDTPFGAATLERV